MPEITYRINTNLSGLMVGELFRKSGISRPVTDYQRIQKMLDNSNLIISAWDGNKLVGIARALTDFNYCCYLSDLAVDRDYQNLGIGKKLVARLKSELSDQVAILLLAAQTATEYYPKLGFEKANNAWIILRSN